MALQPGSRLGGYEIHSAIGAGGMGEVYRAMDSRLHREIAIKLLPDEIANDAQFCERFEREARATAAINHPNIVTIHSVERADGRHFITMELVEGTSLEQLLAKQRLGLVKILDVAIPLADAVAAAHLRGITHRDLKPGNIMIGHDGRVKVLDFGLAKLTDAGVLQATQHTRATGHLTGHGSIVGTVAYMSPEQAEGKTIDHRTDLFSIGVILYEMATGTRPFRGDTPLSVLSGVVKDTPRPANEVNRDVPRELAKIIRRCLAKDPDDRYQSAKDLRNDLRELKRDGESGELDRLASTPRDSASLSASTVGARRLRTIHAAWGAVVALLLTLIAALVYRSLGAPAIALPATTRFEVATPATNDPWSFAISPNGRRLAFVATAEGNAQLFVRSLDQLAAQGLAGTAGASLPFWSPDGASIGFFADGKLKRLDFETSQLRVLADAPFGRGATWGRSGAIVFAPTTASGLMQVSADGGALTAATQLAEGERSHRWPQFLPDGQRFLFLSTQAAPHLLGTFIASPGGQPVRVLEDDSQASFVAPDQLLVVRRGSLVALRFDSVTNRVQGPPTVVAQPIGFEPSFSMAAFVTSEEGVLAYRPNLANPRQLSWFDRSGKPAGTVGPVDFDALTGPELSPDGSRIAMSRLYDSNSDVWVIQASGGVPSRLTSHELVDLIPTWFPDGERLLFGSNRAGPVDIYEKPADGSREERLFHQTPVIDQPNDISSDGRFLLYVTQGPKTGVDIWALPLQGEKVPMPIVQSVFDEMASQFSPDGRWVAYQSNASGRLEVYVRPFPGPGSSVPVSSSGGTQPRWRRDGKELFYVAADNRLMAVPIRGSAVNTIDAGAPVPLFTTRLATGAHIIPASGSRAQYDVAADGRFLMNVSVDNVVPPIVVVLNWQAGLRK